MDRDTIGLWLSLLGLLQWLSRVPAYHPNSLSEMSCFHRLDRLEHEPVFAPQPPDVSGLWTSYRCEVRPGPEFLLRKYKFENNSTFVVYQFYYSDPDCTSPTYSVRASGRYRPVRKAWSVPGGTEIDYRLSRVSLMPYTVDMADLLNQRVKTRCAFMDFQKWKPYEAQDIFNFPEKSPKIGQETLPPTEGADFDCSHVTDFTLHELQLMRREIRLRHPHVAREEGYQILQLNQSGEDTIEELYLGDIHTELSQRRYYRPSSYQIALRKPKMSSSCAVCDRLANADVFFPPELHHRHGTMISLFGEWVSQRCEARPHGMFLTRRLIFPENSHRWEGYYVFFHDSLCRDKTFTLYAQGNYAPGSISGVISGAQHYDFKVNRVKVTPNDRKTTDLFNGYSGDGCGKPKSWKINVEQDVTHTNGCETLGIRLPYIEYDLMKMEYKHWKYHLFIGQRPTDGKPIKSPERRPTSFQAPLVKCEPIMVALAYTKDHDRRALDDPSSTANSLHLTGLTSIGVWLSVITLLVRALS